jgi:hypothetical protein
MILLLKIFLSLSCLVLFGWIAANWGRPVDEEGEMQDYLDYLAWHRESKGQSQRAVDATGMPCASWNEDHDSLSHPTIRKVSAHGYVLHRGTKKTEIH